MRNTYPLRAPEYGFRGPNLENFVSISAGMVAAIITSGVNTSGLIALASNFFGNSLQESSPCFSKEKTAFNDKTTLFTRCNIALCTLAASLFAKLSLIPSSVSRSFSGLIFSSIISNLIPHDFKEPNNRNYYRVILTLTLMTSSILASLPAALHAAKIINDPDDPEASVALGTVVGITTSLFVGKVISVASHILSNRS